MKVILSILFVFGSLFADEFNENTANGIPEKPKGLVSDCSGLLKPEQKQRLEALAAKLTKRTGVPVYLVLQNGFVMNPLRAKRPGETGRFAERTASLWGLGQEPYVLLVLAQAEHEGSYVLVGQSVQESLAECFSDKEFITSFIYGDMSPIWKLDTTTKPHRFLFEGSFTALTKLSERLAACLKQK